MGSPRRLGKKYQTPKRKYEKATIEEDRKMLEEYGLKNKKELLMFKTMLRNKRITARKILALPADQLEKEKKVLINSLVSLALLRNDATMDSILSLKVEDFLQRRLVYLVFRNALANTIKQARQFVTHGRIAIDGKKVKSPNYLVPKDLENKINYYKGKKPRVLDAKLLKKPELQGKEETKEEATAVNVENKDSKEKVIL